MVRDKMVYLMTKRNKLLHVVRSFVDNLENKASQNEWDARTVADTGNSTYYDAKADAYTDLKANLERFQEYVETNADDNATNQDFYIEGMIDAAKFYFSSLERILEKLREGTDYVPKDE